MFVSGSGMTHGQEEWHHWCTTMVVVVGFGVACPYWLQLIQAWTWWSELGGFTIHGLNCSCHNTTWCIVSFTEDATFQFDLIPEFPDDDFDFIVFDYFGNSTCDSIKQKLTTPIRSNLSRRNSINGSVTGLKDSISNLYAAAGVNPHYSKSIDVKKGNKLLIVFDSPYGSKGGLMIKNTSIY